MQTLLTAALKYTGPKAQGGGGGLLIVYMTKGADIFFGLKIYICYLPGGRSEWEEKTVPEVLSMARGRTVLKTKGTVFFPYGPTYPGK